MEKQHTEVVIIGAGYAGMLATVRLAGKLRRAKQWDVNITLVNVSDAFVERLRLHEFAAHHALKRRPIPNTLKGTGVNFVQGNVTRVDASQHTVTVQTDTETKSLSYDRLLYALGSTTDRDSVHGVRENAYTLTPAGPLSAVELRERLPALDEAGGRLVVCGGGATGIESAAEFAGTFPHLKVHLLTRGEFGQFIGKSVGEYMRHSLEKLNVTIQDHTTVTEVLPGEIRTDAGTVPYDVCLWTGGFVAPSLARESGLAVNERGQILVDPFMRSLSHPDIFAIGDAAHPAEEPSVHMRMSAFTALILGAHGADTLAATLQGKTPKPLSFIYMGQGIALGPHNAIGFSKTADDVARQPYFTGRSGHTVRAVLASLLASLPDLERRWPGFYWWAGKNRYAASKQQLQSSVRVDSSL